MKVLSRREMFKTLGFAIVAAALVRAPAQSAHPGTTVEVDGRDASTQTYTTRYDVADVGNHVRRAVHSLFDC